MRESIAQQLPLTPGYADHDHGRELAAMSEILDEHPELVRRVARDLGDSPREKGGRPGMTAEQVLRTVVLKQMHTLSYDDLAFHVADSGSFQRFCRFGAFTPPRRSTLQANIKRLKDSTLAGLNAVLLKAARTAGVETGEVVRFDCTVTASNIHDPKDSLLLWDVVRVLARAMERAHECFGLRWLDRTERSKRRAVEIQHAPSNRVRRKLYRDLLRATEETIAAARDTAATLPLVPMVSARDVVQAEALRHEIEHYAALGQRVVDQTRRRVMDGEVVPAEEKLVSIFEEHTDIIVKQRRETLYGHKLALASGSSGLVLDCQILEGNPADSTLPVTLVERQKKLYGAVPRQIALDGGFASRANLDALKAAEVKDVCFSKGRGIEPSEMVEHRGTYRTLRNFRAGIEASISYLKRCFGLRRCLWSGFASFKAYVWASILSQNLLVLARKRLAAAAPG